MTATLPPSLEDDLKASVGSPTFAVERTETQQPNIAYRWAMYTSQENLFCGLETHLKTYRAQLRGTETILVMCRSRKTVDLLAAKYPSSTSYHSDLPEDVRQRNMELYMSGRAQVMFATSGFGTGVHKIDVPVVVHLEMPYGVLSYAQESGRAGRNGLPALALILSVTTHTFPPRDGDSARLNAYHVMLNMSKGDLCQRQVMSGCLDGEDRQITCAVGRCLDCGVCKADRQLAVDYFKRQVKPPPAYLGPARQHPVLGPKDLVEDFIPRAHNPSTSGPPLGNATSVEILSLGVSKSQAAPSDERRTKQANRLTESIAGSSRRAPSPKPARLEIQPPLEAAIEVMSISNDDERNVSLQVISQSERSKKRSGKQREVDRAPPSTPLNGLVIQPKQPGALVSLDAAVAVARRPLPPPSRQSTDEQLSKNLQAVHQWMRNRCALCTMTAGPAAAAGHTLGSRKEWAAGDCRKGFWNLLQYKDEAGQNWSYHRKENWNLPGGVVTSSACQKEQVGQICWLAWAIPENKEKLFKVFKLKDRQRTGTGYVEWLVQHQDTKITSPNGVQQFGRLNAYRVVVWALFFLKKHLQE
ncbi:Helicase conserved C-terminal domain [Ceratobasidium sp. AG-Ba]|nr:Helicase conserved C-terminal domain [Ceratobasidium sp. AG-Ba]